VRCTFFVDGDILNPWVEDVSELPPRHDGLIRNGTRWLVREVRMATGTREDPAEAWVLLSLPPRLFDEETPTPVAPRRARRRNLSHSH
jgi:hypothetical protein